MGGRARCTHIPYASAYSGAYGRKAERFKQGFAGSGTRRSFGSLDTLAAQDDKKSDGADSDYIVISTEAKRSGEIADYLFTAAGRTGIG